MGLFFSAIWEEILKLEGMREDGSGKKKFRVLGSLYWLLLGS